MSQPNSSPARQIVRVALAAAMLATVGAAASGQTNLAHTQETRGASQRAVTGADSAKMRGRVEGALGAFFSIWRSEWSRNQMQVVKYTPRGLRDRVPTATDLDTSLVLNDRVLSLFCTTKPPFNARILAEYGTVRHPHLIDGFGNVANPPDGRINACPVWVPDAEEPADAQLGADFDLTLGGRAYIKGTARQPLLSLLDSAAAMIPGDGFVAGQRVRMALDQGDVVRARAAAAECRSSEWWCTALAGFVAFWVRDLATADELFSRSYRAMPDAVRCEWNDASLLLSEKDQGDYRRLSCAQRDSVNGVLWWLADPLYLEPGNSRRAEYFGRKMLIAIHSSLAFDERWDWGHWRGGQARAELVERYGWPTSMRYLGQREIPGLDLLKGFPSVSRGIFPLTDEGDAVTPDVVIGPLQPLGAMSTAIQSTPAQRRLDALLAEDRSVREKLSGAQVTFNTPFTTIEYWGPQFHTVPPLSAVNNPFALADSVWDLGPPDREESFDHQWWPREFAKRDLGPLLRLENQTALFRRANASILAAAANWDSAGLGLDRPVTTVFGVTASYSADGMTAVATDTAAGGHNRPIVTALAPRPYVLGLEMLPEAGHPGPARRARFAITPPGTLGTLPKDTVAVSDPLLFDPLDGAPQASLVDVLGRMLPTVDLVRPTRVGVFWETYGLEDTDTTDVAVRIVRYDDRGTVRRALSIVGLGGSTGGSDSVTVRLHRAGQGEASTDGMSRVPIRPGNMVLNVSELTPGRYLLEILVARPGFPIAAGRREFTIRRPK